MSNGWQSGCWKGGLPSRKPKSNVSTQRLPGCCPENEKLRAENAELRAEIARLQAENAELRRRLEMNSSNSHKPPSSDGYRKKRVQPALPKGGEAASRRASGSRRKNPAGGGEAGQNGRAFAEAVSPLRAGDWCGRATPRGRQTPGVRLAEPSWKSPNTAWAKSNAVGRRRAGNIRRM